MPTPRASRPPIAIDVQVRVLFRDGWLCRWCHRPTVFSPTFKLLERFVRKQGWQTPIAYFHPNWRRDAAPLLDHLGAVIDHVEAYSAGGLHGEANFVTACNKCNARKNRRPAKEYELERPGLPVKGRFGEPINWDGLVSLFLILAPQNNLTVTERSWERAFRRYLAQRSSETKTALTD